MNSGYWLETTQATGESSPAELVIQARERPKRLLADLETVTTQQAIAVASLSPLAVGARLRWST